MQTGRRFHQCTHPAIDHEHLASDERGTVACEKGDDIGKLVGCSSALKTLLLDDIAALDLRIGMDRFAACWKCAGRNCIDTHIVDAYLVRQRAGESNHPTL